MGTVLSNPKIRCKCGCLRYLDKFDSWGRPRRFIHGHSSKGNKFALGYRHSAELRKNNSEKHSGPGSCTWKGDDVGYRGLHVWVEKELGKPHFCEHCKRSDLGHRQYHWANVSGEYKRVVSDWLRLCAKCHKKYDKKN